jgi:hypothetical protein
MGCPVEQAKRVEANSVAAILPIRGIVNVLL